MHSIDRKEVTTVSSSISSEGMLEVESEVNQHHKEENLFARYLNAYKYNYEE
jgi:hypothetical protein